MTALGVIGNISIDTAIYPARRFEMLGGAALHVALAATTAGLSAAPISVIGADLIGIYDDPRLSNLDLAAVKVTAGRSCVFQLTYDQAGTLTGTTGDYGAAAGLTDHTLTQLGGFDHYHVCCRRPLEAARVLGRLVSADLPFSVDFHLASVTEQVPAVASALRHATVVFVNTAEYDTLASHIDPESLSSVVISDGPGETRLMEHGRTIATVWPPTVEVAEVTGAGDTLAGTFMAATAHGCDGEQALRTAVTAATAITRRASLMRHG